MDKETFNNEYRQKILILIRIKTNYHRDSEDICQEVLTAAWDALRKDKINDPAKTKAYIKRIYSNKIADHIKRVKSKNENEVVFQENDLDVKNQDQNILDRLILEEERKKLDKALYSLNTQQRMILSLHYDESWSFEKIARFLNLKATTVRKIAARCRKKIAKKFEINY